MERRHGAVMRRVVEVERGRCTQCGKGAEGNAERGHQAQRCPAEGSPLFVHDLLVSDFLPRMVLANTGSRTTVWNYFE